MAGENEAGQTLLVAAEGVEGAVEGVEGSVEGEGDGVMYVTREDGQVRDSSSSLGSGSNDASFHRQLSWFFKYSDPN